MHKKSLEAAVAHLENYETDKESNDDDRSMIADDDDDDVCSHGISNNHDNNDNNNHNSNNSNCNNHSINHDQENIKLSNYHQYARLEYSSNHNNNITG